MLWFLGSLVGIALYLLMAWSLYQMALRQNIEYPWIAFIPIAQFYIIGKLIGSLSIGTFAIPSIEYVLPAGAFLSAIPIPVIRGLISIAFLVVFIFTLLKLYKMYTPDKEVLYTVLSIVLPFLLPIFLFLIKDNTPTQV